MGGKKKVDETDKGRTDQTTPAGPQETPTAPNNKPVVPPGTQIPEKTDAELAAIAAAKQDKLQMAEDSILAQQLGNSFAINKANKDAFASWDSAPSQGGRPMAVGMNLDSAVDSSEEAAQGVWLREGVFATCNGRLVEVIEFKEAVKHFYPDATWYYASRDEYVVKYLDNGRTATVEAADLKKT